MPSRKNIYDKKEVYSWSAKVDFTLGHGAGVRELNHLFEIRHGEPWRARAFTSLLWDQPYILTLESREIHPLQRNAGLTGYRLSIQAEETACGAETLGTKLAFALLDVAVKRNWGLALAWPDSPLPCRVVDRTAGVSIQAQGFATVTGYVPIENFIAMLEQGFSRHSEVPYRLLLSMELFTTSRLESNDRSKLIMLVSALEALAEQRDLSDEIGPLVALLRERVDQSELDDKTLKHSIAGQVRDLARESARRAVKRLIRESGFAEDDARFVEAAYAARSKILHEGRRVPELAAMARRLEKMLIGLYSTAAGD